MEKDELVKQWEDGVSLGSSWWVHADQQKRKRFRELHRTDSHLGLQRSLEDEIIGRLSTGELQAFGIEYGSAGGAIAIPKNYFWKGAEIDFDKDTVAAIGRKFGQVTVQGIREPLADTLPEVVVVDPRQIQAEPESLNILPPVLEWSQESHVTNEREAPAVPPGRAPAPREIVTDRQRGRPSKTPEIEQAIDILSEKGVDLAKMPRPKAFKTIRKCAARELKSDVDIGFSDPVIQRALFNRFGRRR
jgi:hypothetical protein